MPRYDVVCPNNHQQFDVYKHINDPYPVCSLCGEPTTILWSTSAGIATDDIPGGIEIRHGLVHEDGSPMKFYSKSDLKREANRRGYTIAGDTPKPYRVTWSGKRVGKEQ